MLGPGAGSPLAGLGVGASPLPLGSKFPGMLTVDGSMSVVRQDDEASNSGLLDLDPLLPLSRHSGRKVSIRTPVLGPQDSGQLLQLPPLKGKSRVLPRRSSETSWTQPSQATRSASDTRTSSGESNHSVIIHEEISPSKWEHSPDKNETQSRVPSDVPESQTRLAGRMRRWMHDAMKQHMYETAIFWGRHVVAMERTFTASNTATDTAYNDAYWLAQAYFLTHQYDRAEQLLTTPLRSGAVDATASPGDTLPRTAPQNDALHEALEATRAQSIVPDSIRRSEHKGDDSGEDDIQVDNMLGIQPGPSDPYNARRGKRERSSSVDVTEDPFYTDTRPPKTFMPPDEEIQQVVYAGERSSEQGPILVNWSTPCRYLAAQCQVRLGKFHEALELTGEDHTRWTGGSKHSSKLPASDGGLKLGSSVCHLRGQIYLRLDEVVKAREAFMLALSLDVKNYDSFTALIDGNLLGADEQWDFVQALEFASQAGDEPGARDDFEWVRLMYTARLSKQTAAMTQRAAHARQMLLRTHEALRASPDVLLSLAEELYADLRYDDAYTVTSHILKLDPSYMLSLPIHIACMYYLPRLRPALFLLAHKLTEADPESCEAWYAVGVWYASASRWAEARRYFSKSSLLDPRFAPSWIAFGHSFSLEGESDQAITAYSTAARKFQFSGLPRLFIGMEHLLQGNKNLAVIFLNSSAEELGDDPLCANERGVAAFLNGQIPEALEYFRTAIKAAETTQQPAGAWVNVHLNLGLAYSRLHRDDEARTSLLRVIESDPSCATAYIALGICAQRQGDLAAAIDWYHEGLGVDPRDPVGTELLTMALEARLDQGLPPGLVNPGEAGERDLSDDGAPAYSYETGSLGGAPHDETHGSATMDESG